MMRQPGIVNWSDGRIAIRAVVLPDAAAERARADEPLRGMPEGRAPEPRSGDRGASESATHVWRQLWPDLARAVRAGTWGDGGRDC